MSQEWNNIPPTGSVSTALKDSIPDALEALRTTHSGSTAPSSTTAFMLWADTSAGVLKMRNASNTGWITIGPLAERHDWLTHMHQVGAISSTTEIDLFVAPCQMTIDRLLVVSDVTTDGSDGSNYCSVTIENVTQVQDLLSAEQSTEANEILAGVPWAVVPDQNANIQAGDLIRVEFRVMGSGPLSQDLTAARVSLQLQGYGR